MKLIKLLPMVLLVLAITSCATDAVIEESDLTTAPEAVTQTQSTTETPEDDPELIGTWIGTAVAYTGSRVFTAAGEAPIIESFSATALELNYSVTFTGEPNEATGEGLYSVTEETTVNGQTTSRDINNLNLVNSSTVWSLNANALTLDASGKIKNAVITGLTDTTLSLSISETSTIVTDNTTEEIIKNSTLEFTRQ